MMKENELMSNNKNTQKRILRGNDQYLPIILTTLLVNLRFPSPFSSTKFMKSDICKYLNNNSITTVNYFDKFSDNDNFNKS